MITTATTTTTTTTTTNAGMPVRITPECLAHLQDWVGRCETREDAITAAPVRGLAATLDRPELAVGEAPALAPLWRWLYFLPLASRVTMAWWCTVR